MQEKKKGKGEAYLVNGTKVTKEDELIRDDREKEATLECQECRTYSICETFSLDDQKHYRGV